MFGAMLNTANGALRQIPTARISTRLEEVSRPPYEQV
jgi:hypothetical protein